MQVDLAPAARETELLLGRQLLVAEEDHAVVQQRGADFRQHIVRQILGQIDAIDHGAERAGDTVGFQVTVLGVARSVHGLVLLMPGMMPLNLVSGKWQAVR